ncbi:hypothetical protein SAY87_015120 [Trapa incisa]|uniref:Uncharacterized protein n=1 Tax=Trapa incisa TaxID=236973 RepID=A0AAN7GTQ6_9MYRT|nr:hypothetical protein SAY87_015120 [Trapa incisa]
MMNACRHPTRSGLSYMRTARQQYCEDNWDELKNQNKVVDDKDLTGLSSASSLDLTRRVSSINT